MGKEQETVLEKLGNGGPVTAFIRIGVVVGVMGSGALTYDVSAKFTDFEYRQQVYREQVLDSISSLRAAVSSMSAVQDSNRERIRGLEERVIHIERFIRDEIGKD